MEESRRILRSLQRFADPVRAEHSQSFFKTGPGGYGEGDLFLGVRVPIIRTVVREFRGLDLSEIEELLNSKWHEVRLFSLLAMVDQFKRGTDSEQEAIYNLYMGNTNRVNGWDLVDSSAPRIPGAYLWDRNRQPLYEFAVSDSLWKRRIAIISTQHFIRKHSFDETLKIAELLIDDKEDLIHKAVGWMLREVGNRDLHAEEDFLSSLYKKMPRTMLRYAIEKFDSNRRKSYLQGSI